MALIDPDLVAQAYAERIVKEAIEVHRLEPGHQYLLVLDKHQIDLSVCRALANVLKNHGVKGILITANGLPAVQRIEL